LGRAGRSYPSHAGLRVCWRWPEAGDWREGSGVQGCGSPPPEVYGSPGSEGSFPRGQTGFGVAGSVKRNVEPTPSVLSTVTSPS
jgi:hypothetical protein